MLDPEYILRLSEGAEENASKLHETIILAVIGRITARIGHGDDYILTPTDKWQIEVLQEAGYLREDIAKEIAKATRLQYTEIREAFEAAGIKAIEYDNAIYEAAGLSPLPFAKSPYLIRLMQRNYEATLGEWENFTRTTADSAQQLFIQQCDKVYMMVATGAESYTQAVAEAVETIASDGVTVTYPSGWVDTIETATLRAVRTGVGQACAEITQARMDEMEWDTVLVSAHLGARYGDGGENFTNHFWWQGKFYSKSGMDPKFPPLSVCGLGDIKGLCGANCRHNIGPGDGKNNPFDGFDSEENKKAYDLSQQQRKLERRIRKTKRECVGYKAAVDGAEGPAKAELQAEYESKARLLKRQNEAYNQFCEDNGLKRLPERLQIAQWDRKQAKAAMEDAK